LEAKLDRSYLDEYHSEQKKTGLLIIKDNVASNEDEVKAIQPVEVTKNYSQDDHQPPQLIRRAEYYETCFIKFGFYIIHRESFRYNAPELSTCYD